MVSIAHRWTSNGSGSLKALFERFKIPSLTLDMTRLETDCRRIISGFAFSLLVLEVRDNGSSLVASILGLARRD